MAGNTHAGRHLDAVIYMDKKAGFPARGSLAFSRALEKKYTDLSGQIQYRKRVDRIPVDHGKAVPAERKIENLLMANRIYGMHYLDIH